jgi:hypothetical protein
MVAGNRDLAEWGLNFSQGNCQVCQAIGLSIQQITSRNQ